MIEQAHKSRANQ